jgi:hypothetical protein
MTSRSTLARVGVGIVLGLALGIVLHEATKVREVNFKAEEFTIGGTLENSPDGSDGSTGSNGSNTSGAYCCNRATNPPSCQQK